jgi:hypothetical protein
VLIRAVVPEIIYDGNEDSEWAEGSLESQSVETDDVWKGLPNSKPRERGGCRGLVATSLGSQISFLVLPTSEWAFRR